MRAPFPSLRAGFWTVAIAIAIAAVWAIWSPWTPSRWWAERLAATLEQAPDEHLPFYAAQLVMLDESSWTVWARVENSPRPAVGEAVRQALRDRLHAWRQEPSELIDQRLIELAQMLRQTSRSEPASLDYRAELAELMLGWPGGGPRRIACVAICEDILRQAKEGGWPRPRAAEPAPEPPSLAQQVARENAAVGLPAPPPRPDPIRLLDEEPTLPPEPTPEEIASLQPLGPHPELLFVPSATRAAQLKQRAESEESQGLGNPPTAAAVASPIPTEPPPVWTSLTLPELIRAWRRVEYRVAIEEEWRRRRLSETDILVARVAADPDFERKLRLIEALPQLVGVDPVAWLLVLSHDDSPRVRQAAVQRLATGSDPRIRAHLEALERDEVDAEVHLSLRRALEMQR